MGEGLISNQNTVGTMRQGSNPKGRSRGRGANNKKNGSIRTSPFDGAPSTRVRGNAHQLMDKYLALARDASAIGDRVMAENYFQHADHYYRLMNNAANANGRGPRQSPPQATPAMPTPDIDEVDNLEQDAEDAEKGEEGSAEMADF